MIHHYAKLGLKPGASEEEIKASYRRLVKKFHPDRPGGNAVFFAQVKDAYDVLSDPVEREKSLRLYKRINKHKPRRTPEKGKREAAPQRPRARAAKPAPAPPRKTAPAPKPAITRIMSVALARSGWLVFDNIFGKVVVEPTTPYTMWATTLAKFGDRDKKKLARHVVQVRVTGDRELVRGVELKAMEYGLLLRTESTTLARDGFAPTAQAAKTDNRPLVVRCSVPMGTPLHFRNTFGTINLGDLDNELRAQLESGTRLRAGSMERAALTMQDASMAFLSHLSGDADVLMNGSSKLLLDGDIQQLRAVLEKESVIEVVGPIAKLNAEVNGDAFLHIKDSVAAAYCDAHDNGFIRIAQLKNFLVGQRTEHAKVEVVRKPASVPVRRTQTPAAAAGA